MANDWQMVATLAGVSTLADPQPDPNASLGRMRSSTPVEDYLVQTTSVTDESTFISTTLISESIDPGAWVTMHTPGSNLNEAREIVAFDTGTGEVSVDQPFSAVPGVGDRFRVWRPNGLFAAISNARSVTHPENGIHRMITVRNETGGLLGNPQAYVVPVRPGPLKCEIAMSGNQVGEVDCIEIAVDTDEPDLVTAGTVSGRDRFAGPTGFWRPQRFDDPPARDRIYDTPVNIAAAWTSNFVRAMWLKLAFRLDEPMALPYTSVFQVIYEDDAGSPTSTGSMLIVVDILGPNELITAGVDRQPRVGGGARVEVRSIDVDSGLPVPNRTVTISQTAGSGTLQAQNKDQTDDTNQPVARVYTSSTNPADEGDTITFSIEVN